MLTINLIVPLQASEGRSGKLWDVLFTSYEASLQMLPGYLGHCVGKKGTFVDRLYQLERRANDETVSGHGQPTYFTGEASGVQAWRQSNDLQQSFLLQK